MAIITRDSPPCKLEEWVSYALKTSIKKENKSPRTSSIVNLIERAFDEGCKLLDIKAIICVYSKKDNDADTLYLETPEGAGFRINAAGAAAYFSPAREIAVALCTVGGNLEKQIDNCRDKDPLFAYYLEKLGEYALSDIGGEARKYIENLAQKDGCGVSPTLLPGSVSGWNVTGQRDLFYLGHGGDIGLSINEASFLIPRMSKSFIIGIGKEYKDTISKSLCDKCPKFSICSWRRVDEKEN